MGRGDATRRSWVAGNGLAPPLRSLWRRDSAQRAGEPVVGDGRVYVPLSRGVVALDLRTGRSVWRVGFPSEVYGVVYGDGRVVVSTLGGPVAQAAATGMEVWRAQGPAASFPLVTGGLLVDQGETRLLALDLATGAPRWSAGLGGGALGRLAASGDRVYFEDTRIIAALDRTTGAPIWQHGNRCVGIPFGGDVLVYGDRVYSEGYGPVRRRTVGR